MTNNYPDCVNNLLLNNYFTQLKFNSTYYSDNEKCRGMIFIFTITAPTNCICIPGTLSVWVQLNLQCFKKNRFKGFALTIIKATVWANMYMLKFEPTAIDF